MPRGSHDHVDERRAEHVVLQVQVGDEDGEDAEEHHEDVIGRPAPCPRVVRVALIPAGQKAWEGG